MIGIIIAPYILTFYSVLLDIKVRKLENDLQELQKTL